MTAYWKAETSLWWQRSAYQSYGFSSSHVWMWELDHKEGWVLKNWRFWTVMLGKNLESPPDSKDIKPVNPKGNQLWIFVGRTGAEVEAPILWLPDMKSQLIGKDPASGKDWGQEKKGGDRGWDGWMASLTQWTWVWANSGGDDEGQGSLACCSSWDLKESDMTERLTTHHSSPFSLLQEALGLHLWTHLSSCFQLDADNWVTGGQEERLVYVFL